MSTDETASTPRKQRKPRRSSSDPEASAIALCWKALEPLDREARVRVMDFIDKRGEAKT